MIRFVSTSPNGPKVYYSIGAYKITRSGPRRRHTGIYCYRVHVLIDPDEQKYRKLPGEHRSFKLAEAAANAHAAQNGDKTARSLRDMVDELLARVAQLEGKKPK